MTAHIISWIAAHSVYAIVVLMAIDAVLPAGGEVVMLFGGALASGAVANEHVVLFGTPVPSGLAGYAVVVAAGTLGYLGGSLAGWAVGAHGGRTLIERHGRWLHLGPARFARAERWFTRYGSATVFFGRLTPLVRSFVSIPAGVMRQPRGSYTVLTLAASLIWCAGFAAAGWALGNNWETVHHAFRYADYAAVLAVVAIAVVAFLHRRRSPRVGTDPSSGARDG